MDRLLTPTLYASRSFAVSSLGAPDGSRTIPLTERRALSDSHEIEKRVIETLGGIGVPYELVQIDPAYADTAAFCEKYGFPPERSGNTIIVGSKKEPRQFSACLVLATSKLDVNHAVRDLMGVSRLSFATADDTTALTGMLIGGVTVFALPPELPIYVDEKVMALDWVILGSGSRSSKIKTSPEALRRLPNARVVPALTLGASSSEERVGVPARHAQQDRSRRA